MTCALWPYRMGKYPKAARECKRERQASDLCLMSRRAYKKAKARCRRASSLCDDSVIGPHISRWPHEIRVPSRSLNVQYMANTPGGRLGNPPDCHEHVASHEMLKPLDARQDKNMNWRWRVDCASERPLPSMHAFSEATELLIWNSRKQHRINTAPVHRAEIIPRRAFSVGLIQISKGEVFSLKPLKHCIFH